ncbi:MAG TPA: LuxR C-terminal-related transcriptional regulator [Pseudonocardiaceae bacterium]
MTEPRMELDADEIELIRLYAEGVVNEVVARQLRVSERTVRRRIRALCDRFGVQTPVQLVVIAARQGVL